MAKKARLALAVLLFAGFGLAGCGVKGPLERPKDAPKELAPGPDGKKPHKSFVLDGLL